MGGEEQAVDQAAADVLRWWLESGVDVLVQEEPRNWLSANSAPSTAEPAGVEESPRSLDEFRSWLRDCPTLPFAASGARRVLPQGAAEAEIMLLADMPDGESIDDAGPIAGDAWRLTERMLAAIGLKAEAAYVTSLSCFQHSGPADKDTTERCAAIARTHIALAKPRRLLLLGDGPSRALLGRPLVDARGHVHKIEGVRTIATFHPRFLLDRPANKALAWKDLLLLMETET